MHPCSRFSVSIPRYSAHRLALAVAVVLGSGALAPLHADAADGLQFSEGFLIGGEAIDLQHYAQGNPLAPGVYPLELVVNGAFRENRDITFVAASPPRGAVPCLPAALVRELGLKESHLATLADDPAACVDLPSLVDGATVSFDAGTLQLLVTLPQAAQANTARGFVAPSLRDHGVTAAFLDYSLNHNRSNAQHTTSASMHAGLNLGAWRLRHRAFFSQGAQGSHHDVISSHLQRDVPAWNSQLLLGQSSTGGELFESVAFSGVRVATDERMLPDSLRGFAPVVQGIAEGNAIVTIRQNGHVIHDVAVAPGPFSIEDLYPTNFGGDLDVTVTEADGREQRFKVSFSAVPQALRPGASRFSATAGQLRDAGRGGLQLRFAEGTYVRGLSNRFTALGGMQAGEGFQAALFGGAVNTPIGAFGADITHSRARLSNDAQVTGNSLRVNFQRYVAASGTNFGLAAHRYSTQGYLTLTDFADARSDDWGYGRRARQRYQVNFSQRLGERSTLSLSGGRVSYWDSVDRQNDFQLRFQSAWGQANYGLSALRYQIGNGRHDTRYSFNMSVPLGRSPNAPRASSLLSQGANGQQVQLGLNGALGDARALSYSLSAGDGRAGQSSASAYAAYQGGRGNLSAGYSRSGDYSSLALGAAGSLVLHAGGVNRGAPVGDGFALIQAEGAHGAKVGYGNDTRVARNGYALLPHVSPYRWNQIDLDPSDLPLEVELLQTSQRVAPTAGSIVRVAFNAKRERTLFIDATDALGQPLPFAARIEDDTGRAYGAVGQGGVIQLRGAPERGQLIVDPNGPQRCRLDYTTPDVPDPYGLSWSQAICTPLPAPSAGLQAAREATTDASF
ncbi:fimbria/pilus outer membrane usher protein [Stenotrophomonas rhizophila]